MKPTNRMNNEAASHKWFIETATFHHQQWRLVKKLSIELATRFRDASDEQSACRLITERHERLQIEWDDMAFELLRDYNFNVSTMYFLTEPSRACKQDRVWTCKWINKLCEYADIDIHLAIIQFSVIRKTHEQWTYQHTSKHIAYILDQLIQDAPAFMYNRFRVLGLSEQAFAVFVGMKSAEMTTKGRIKHGLARRVKYTQKGEGNKSHDPVPAEINRAKYEALRDDMVENISYSKERCCRFNGKQFVLPPLMCLDENGERRWRDTHSRVAKQLGAEAYYAMKFPVRLDSELYKETADGSEADSLLDSIPDPRDIDPAEKFRAKEEARIVQIKKERFRQSLSPQQLEFFDFKESDPDLPDEEIARQMGLTTANIYNLRSRLKIKWAKMNEDT